MSAAITQAVLDTAYNRDWVAKHRDAIRELFPETWTHIANVNFLAIRFRLKLLGVDFRTDDEVAWCLTAFERAKLMLRDGILIRRGMK